MTSTSRRISLPVGSVDDGIRWISKLIPLVTLVVFWELVSGSVVPANVLPPFSQVASYFVELWTTGQVQQHLFATLYRGVMGILIAILIGAPLGLAMFHNDRIYRNVDPIISLTYPIPKSALIPLLLVWLGSGHNSRIALAFVGAILPILINTYNGASSVSEKVQWAAKSMGLTDQQTLYKVILPMSLPYILTGIRLGLIFSFIIVVSSEMIIADLGLGVLIMKFGQFGNYDQVFAVIIWIALIVAGLDRLYLLLTNYTLQWSQQEVGGI